jgi:hypothetical protein
MNKSINKIKKYLENEKVYFIAISKSHVDLFCDDFGINKSNCVYVHDEYVIKGVGKNKICVLLNKYLFTKKQLDILDIIPPLEFDFISIDF